MIKARESLDANFLALKEMIFGLGDRTEESGRVALKSILDGDFISTVMAGFNDISFVNRKHFTDIVNFVLKKEGGEEHMLTHANLIYRMVDAVSAEEQSQTALLYLDMIKSCCQQPALLKLILTSEKYWLLWQAVELPDFAVSASAFLVVRDSVLLVPSTLTQVMEGDRLDKFVATLAHFCTVGSGSQKKKSLDLVFQLLSSTQVLLPPFAASVDMAKALESAVLARGKVAAAAFPLMALLLGHESTSAEVCHVYGQPTETKNVLLEVLAEEKADASLVQLVEKCE